MKKKQWACSLAVATTLVAGTAWAQSDTNPSNDASASTPSKQSNQAGGTNGGGKSTMGKKHRARAKSPVNTTMGTTGAGMNKSGGAGNNSTGAVGGGDGSAMGAGTTGGTAGSGAGGSGH